MTRLFVLLILPAIVAVGGVASSNVVGDGKCTDPNEVFDNCTSSCTSDRCDFKPDPDIGCAAVCVEACRCADGYCRDSNDICVLKNTPTPLPVPNPGNNNDNCAGDNEVFKECTNSCTNDSCFQGPRKPTFCTTLCKPACVCAPGYCRDGDKNCVKRSVAKPQPQPISDPGPKCGPSETETDCPSNCPDRCPRSEEDAKRIRACKAADSCPVKKKSCTCGFNQRRAKNGTCISVYDCPAFDCSSTPNQEYNTCASYCPGEGCESANPTATCPAFFGILPVVMCEPSCHCKKYYWRKDGKCVTYEQCQESGTTTTTTTTEAPPSGCGNGPKCGRNEQKECRVSCQKDTCASLVSKFPCVEGEQCNTGCFCKSGYLRLNETEPCRPQCECKEIKKSLECMKK